ncbi:MAG TPA: hypothetical protein VGL61_05405 [Kofleriaceae bacterium]|jgi:hypothetical protein
MADEVRLDGEAIALLSRIVDELAETRRAIEALAHALGVGESMPGMVLELRKRDEQTAGNAANDERTAYIDDLMASCQVHGRTARLAWLTRRLSHDPYGPIHDTDIERYRLRPRDPSE